jgi:hypothetical protein
MAVTSAHCESCSHASEPCGRARAKHLSWATGLLGVFPFAYFAAPLIRRDALPICPFRCATGRPCPFCGLTRAFAAATHLQWQQALHFNPLWPLAAAVIIGLSILHLCDAVTRRSIVQTFTRAARHRWISIVVLLIAFDLWRILFFDR